MGVRRVDFETAVEIEGEESQIATVTLRRGQTIRAESGSMLYMTEGVEMETSSNLSEGMNRFLTGQTLFMTDFTNRGERETETVALGTAFPSKILKASLRDYPRGTLVAQKSGFLASTLGVRIEMAFAKSLSAGFFGGEGFVLTRLTGDGDVLIQGGGTIARRDLRGGETLRVSSGCLVAMTATVDYDVQIMPGFRNVLFGGEGLFVTTLRGPGTVWMQGMPPDRMISEIARRVPAGGGGGIGFGVPIVGGDGGGGDGDGEDASPGAGGAAEEGGISSSSSSDAAIEADRQATVATSSGVDPSSYPSSDSAGSPSVEDPDSPSALFGDAVSGDPSFSSPSPSPTSATFEEDASSFGGGGGSSGHGSFEKDFSDDTTTSFSTEGNDFADFPEDDDTTFSTAEGGSGDTTEDSLGGGFEAGDASAGEEAQSTASGLLDFFMDIFRGDD